MDNNLWSSKKAFVLASVGAAVGLGNIWRFPYIASENGGIWFLLPYFICLIAIGIPLFLLEAGQGFALKRGFFKSVESSTNLAFVKKNLRRALGILPILITTVIMGYYIALCSWTLWFAANFILGTGPTFGIMSQTFSPLIAFLIVFVCGYLIAQKGISKGIEPATSFLVPLLFFFLIALFFYALSLPGSTDYISSQLEAGPGKLLEPRTWYYALSQVLFSLSVGYGIMFTYGMHLRGGKGIFSSSFQIAGADSAASLLSFFTIATLGAMVGAAGSGLAFSFEALPIFFASQGALGTLAGAAFFTLLFTAAFTSIISMLDHTRTSTSFLHPRARHMVAGAVFVIGLASVLSYSPMNLQVFERPVLDLLDFVFGTFLAPFTALAVVICCAYLLPFSRLAATIGIPRKYHAIFLLTVRKILPGAFLLLILFSQLTGLY